MDRIPRLNMGLIEMLQVGSFCGLASRTASAYGQALLINTPFDLMHVPFPFEGMSVAFVCRKTPS